MPDNPQSEPTTEEIKHLLQEAILRNYPNPERRGCFDEHTLRNVAEKRLPYESPQWQHITHCSPCYQEFLDLRRAFLERKRRRRWFKVATVAAMAAVGAVVAIFLSLNRLAPRVPPGQNAGKTLTAVLNMQASPTRGVEGLASGSSDLQRLPRVQMAPLLIYLPFGSDPGNYSVELLQDEKDAAPLATFSGTANIRDGLTVLQVSPDLSRFGSGTYVFSVFRVGSRPWICRFILS